MKFKSMILLVCMAVVSHNLGYAQLTDYNFLGGGARAKAMGGAFFGVSDDPSAASWNPAGLTQLDKYQMTLNFTSNNYKTSFAQALSRGESSKSISEGMDDTRNIITFGSVVIPFQVKKQPLVGSVVYSRISDVGGSHLFYTNNYLVEEQKEPVYSRKFPDILVTTFALNSKMHEIYRIFQILTFPPLGEPRTDAIGYFRDQVSFDITDFELEEEMDGGLDKFSLALAGNPIADLSLGLAVNIYTGGYTLEAKQPGFVLVEGESDTMYLDLKPSVEADYSGFNLTLSAMYQFQNLRVGGVVKTPYTLKEKQDIKLEWDERVWNEVDKKWEINPNRTSTRGLFYPIEYRQKWEMPLSWGIGASYLIQNLTLAGDIEMTQYSKTELSYPQSPNYSEGDFNPPIDPSLPDRTVKLLWEDVAQFRLGAEYLFSTEYGKIPLRVGYRNDPKPYTSVENVKIDTLVYPDDTQTPPRSSSTRYTYDGEKGDKITGSVFTLGTGIGWSQIMFDITYEYSRYEIKASGTSVALPEIGVSGQRYQDFDETVERKNHKIMIGFTGFF
ncbi:MAG: hypothetical protein AMJ90_01085 [candidate division Zixibacteria bacterium SM23_73_2]|nr:MAG: hypothetical protein AMJ90_01085 [candidate division Zixibacteria bacterium SM23_73_2]